MGPVIRHVDARSVITRTDLPVCDYAVNPYVGCTHGCRYCYANKNPRKAFENYKHHNPKSPILLGDIKADDVIIEGAQKSFRIPKQLTGEQIRLEI